VSTGGCAGARAAYGLGVREIVGRARPGLLAVAVVALGVAGRPEPGPGLHGDGLTVLLALVAVAVGAVRLLGGQPLWVDFALVVAGSAVLVWLEPAGVGFLGGFVAAGAAGSTMDSRAGAVVTAVAVAAVGAAGLGGAARPAVSVLVGVLGVVAFYFAGRYARRLRERTAQAERLAADLDRGRAAQAEAAVLAERQRLAGEVHDVLALTLSGLVLQLEAAQLLARQEADPRLAEAVDRAHELARSGLDDSRLAIGALRDEHLLGPEQLPALAREFEQDTGVPVAVTVTGPDRPYSPPIRLALYRVAQEALTDAVRRASPDRVEVSLAHALDGPRLSIQDIGAAAGGPAGGSRYGLTGMRERAELLGGTLTVAPTSTGFRVDLWIPA
jgi:signal transduction histidine kinase